jgi:hypothetical protein
MMFFIVYGLNAKKNGKRVYRVGPVFLVFCFSVIVSAFFFSIVNQVFDMEWVQSPKDFLKNQIVFALGPFIGFALSTIVRGDWKKEEAKKEEEAGKQAPQKQSAKIPMPASSIALLSGISSSLGYLLHLGFLLVIFLLKGPSNLLFLVPTYLASVLLGEWIFWSTVGIEPPLSKNLKKAICSDPFYLVTIISEFSFHGLLLHMVLQADWNPLHYYLILLGCRVVGGPVQSYLSYFFLPKLGGYLLAVGLQVLCFKVAKQSPSTLLPMIILFGLLGNAITVSRSQRASEYFEQKKLKNGRLKSQKL